LWRQALMEARDLLLLLLGVVLLTCWAAGMLGSFWVTLKAICSNTIQRMDTVTQIITRCR
jgi:hypothetical protein